MNRLMFGIACLLTITLSSFALAADDLKPATPAPRVRIGVYESRALAVAFAASTQHNQAVAELMQQSKEAQARGDTARVNQLKAQAKQRQVKFHLQGFSSYPVDDILEHLRDALPEIAAKAGVVAIVPKANWHNPDIETVDVTDQLVARFNPQERTLKIIKDLRTKPPLEPAVVLEHKD